MTRSMSRSEFGWGDATGSRNEGRGDEVGLIICRRMKGKVTKGGRNGSLKKVKLMRWDTRNVNMGARDGWGRSRRGRKGER